MRPTLVVYKLLSSSDAWAALELAHGAPAQQVRKTYHRLSKQVHPDKCTSRFATAAFQRLQQLRDALLSGRPPPPVHPSSAEAAAEAGVTETLPARSTTSPARPPTAPPAWDGAAAAAQERRGQAKRRRAGENEEARKRASERRRAETEARARAEAAEAAERAARAQEEDPAAVEERRAEEEWRAQSPDAWAAWKRSADPRYAVSTQGFASAAAEAARRANDWHAAQSAFGRGRRSGSRCDGGHPEWAADFWRHL